MATAPPYAIAGPAGRRLYGGRQPVGGALYGSAALDSVAAAGGLQSLAPTQLSGNAALDSVSAAGGLQSLVPTQLSGNATLDSVSAAGTIGGAVTTLAATAAGLATATISSAAGATNEPVTFGMALREGAFPPSPGIAVDGLLASQVEWRNTWADGSAKFVVVSGRCTVGAAGTITATLTRAAPAGGTALTEADLLASGVDATLQFAGGPTMTLSALIGVAAASNSTGLTTNGRVRTLSSGPQMSSWLYAARLSSGNAHVIGWMEVRFYGGTKVHVLPWVENGFTRIAGCAGQAGTLTFTLAGSTRYNQANVHLANHCRVVAQDVTGIGYWAGTAPDVYAAPDPIYLQSTGLVPPFSGRDTSGATARLDGLAQTYSPTLFGQLTTSPRDGGGNGTDNGEFDAGMANAGYHAGIGPLPEWEVFYLTSKGDRRAWRAVVANAMGYGRYGVHFRDELTLAPVNPADVVNKTLPQGSNHNIAYVGANQFGGSETLPTVAAYDPTGLNLKPEYWAQSHHPSGGFTAYLLTGHEFFLELAQMIAGTCFLAQNNLQRNYGQGILNTVYEQVRGAAWQLRSMFQAATVSRDGSALQTGFAGIVSSNIAYYHGLYSTPGSVCGSFGVPRFNANQFNTDPTVPQYRINGFEVDFSVSAWGYGLAMKPPVGTTALANMRTFFQWHAQWPVVRLGPLGDATAYGFNAAARTNSFSVAPSYTDAPWVSNTGWYTNPGQMFQDTFKLLKGTFSDVGSIIGTQTLLTVAGSGSARDITVIVSGITGTTTVRLEVSTNGSSWSTAATYSANTAGTTFNDGLTGTRFYRLYLAANDGPTITASIQASGSNANNTVNTIGAWDNNNGNFPDATSYWANLQTGLAYAVEHGVSGAWDAYLRMVNAPNWSSFDTAAATNPVGSLRSSLSPNKWAAAAVADQFVDMGASQAFLTWANAGGIPAAAYRGTGPFANMLDGYSDPAEDDGAQYIYGGGHGDGTCDAVVKFDYETLTYSLVGTPTPPAVYHPQYIVNGDPTIKLFYPSGAYYFGGAITQSPRNPPFPYGYFLTVNEGLNATVDAGYIAPALSRMTTHVYGAAVKRGDVIHHFYLSYGEFNVKTGKWTSEGFNCDIGGQLAALSGSFGSLTNEPMAPGTYALYDEVTDRIVVTCQSQDRASGNRRGLFLFNPVTRQIESYHRPDGLGGYPILGSAPMVKVNRNVWIFTRPDLYDTNVPWNQGFIFNLDTKTWSQFTIQGDPAATYMNPSNTVAETLPMFFDGTRIVRWNYYVNANQVHFIVPTPVSGAGTSASPYVFAQTSRTISGAPGFSKLVYKRLFWSPRNRCAVLFPQASSKPVILKLS